MKQHLLNALALSCGVIFSTAAFAQSLPFHPQPANAIKSDSENATGSSRLKVSLTVSQDAGRQPVLVGNATACSASDCYRPITAPKTALLYTTKEGKAEAVAEFAIPRVKILSIHFESLPGAKTVAGSINIDNPMEFDQEYFGENILVVLNDSPAKNGQYSPKLAVAGPFHPAVQTVYYNPAVATIARLGMSTALSIPARATGNPVIFTVAVHDTLDKFPLVDIYPAISLDPPATLSSQEVQRGSNLAASAATSAAAPAPAASSTKNLHRTGVIRLDSSATNFLEAGSSASADSSGARVLTAAAATNTCTSFLTSKLQAISSALATTGTVRIRECETMPPYIHIAVSNMLDSREQGSLAYIII